MSPIELKVFVVWPILAACLVSPIVHSFVPRFWFGALWTAAIAAVPGTIAGLIFWLHEPLPWSKLLWLPMVYAQNAGYSFIVAVVLGFPFLLVRRREKRSGARATPPNNHSIK